MLFYDGPYSRFLPRWIFYPAKPVRHQQTCPVCGRKLVNTYFRGGEWKCRRCWEQTVNKKQEPPD